METVTTANRVTAYFSDELLEVYEPLEIIGYGAFSMVVKAKDRRSGKMVAIKHFPGSPCGDGGKNYYRELRHVMSLKHPNIVACLDVCTTGEGPDDLVFEFADEGSLREQITDGQPVALDTALPVLRQVTRGIVHAHENSIVHRDLKPENILIFSGDAKAKYKISDFGIARFLGPQQRTMTSIGSPAYMAPEQFYDEYDFKTDIYGLGIIFFELLHGYVPFQGSPAMVFRGHNEQDPPFDDSVPEELRSIVSRLMEKDKNARPDAKEALRLIEELHGEADADSADAHHAHADAHADSFSAHSIFGDMFSEDSASSKEAAVINEQETWTESEGDESHPAVAISDSDSPEAGEPILFFSDGEKEETPAPEPAVEEPDEEPAPANIRAEGAEEALNTASAFGEGFEDAASGEIRVIENLKEVAQSEVLETAGLRAERLWSRAVDTKVLRLVNLEKGDDLLIVTREGVYGLKKSGVKGKRIYDGKPESVGTASRGSLPIIEGSTIRVLTAEGLLERDWTLEAEIDQVALTPAADGIAVVIGHMVCFHDQDGNHLWTGQFDREASRTFISFDEAGRLMVVALNSEDHVAHFYNREGDEVASHWLPGPALAVSRSRSGTGAWALVNRRKGLQLLHVAVEGIASACTVDMQLSDLVGPNDWVAGVDENKRLRVVDPRDGAALSLPVEGNILDIEQGRENDTVVVLEQRGEIMKYITAWRITAAS